MLCIRGLNKAEINSNASEYKAWDQSRIINYAIGQMQLACIHRVSSIFIAPLTLEWSSACIRAMAHRYSCLIRADEQVSSFSSVTDSDPAMALNAH